MSKFLKNLQKRKKNQKRGWHKGKKDDILNEQFGKIKREELKKVSNKKVNKKSKKAVDKHKNVWYIRNATCKERQQKRKDLWKLSKTSIWEAREKSKQKIKDFIGEFDPGSGWTLAACLRHASRTRRPNEDWVLAQSWIWITV